MASAFIRDHEVIKTCTLCQTGERFFQTREGIFNERGNLVSQEERPDVWQLLAPNAIVVDDLRGALLSRFAVLETLLEPRPAAELFDYEYNLMMRDARRDAWDNAHLTFKHLQTKSLAQRYEACHIERVLGHKNGGDELWNSANRLTAEMHLAIAELILTPAPHSEAIKIKLRMAKSRGVPISQEEVADAIAKDERFLAAHPIRRADFIMPDRQKVEAHFPPA
jgi:hypothetical protein